MIPISKRFIVLVLVFSLFMMSCTVLDIIEIGIDKSIKKASPARKKGTKLIIQKVDEKQLTGELIAVRSNSLLLSENETETDISIHIIDVKAITIIKKKRGFSDPLRGAASGAGVSVGLWLLGGLIAPALMNLVEESEKSWLDYLPGYVAYGALAGAAIGGIASLISPSKEIFQLEGMTDSEIQEVLFKLSKKARNRDYR